MNLLSEHIIERNHKTKGNTVQDENISVEIYSECAGGVSSENPLNYTTSIFAPDQDVSHVAVSSQQCNYAEVNDADFITLSEEILINNQTDIQSSQASSRQQIYASTSQNQTLNRTKTGSRDQTDLKEQQAIDKKKTAMTSMIWSGTFYNHCYLI